MKNIILKSCLIALCLICGLGNAWGDTVTFTTAAYNGKGGASGSGGSATATISGVTLSSTKAYYTEDHIREYSGGTITLSSENKITQIEFTSTTSGTSNNGPGKISLKSGYNGSYSYSGTVGTWKYNSGANEIVFNCDAQFRWTQMVVTYESSTPTARTVTFDAGSNGTCTTTSLTEASAGAGVTLPSCTPNTNYTFVGWSTSSTPTSADAGTAGENYKPSSDCTLYAYYTYQAPSHTAHFSINGTINDAYDCTVTEGSAITFPTGLADINGKKFVGWGENTISGTTDNKPTIVESATMRTSDVTYYAVYATQTGGGAPSYEKLASSSFDTNATYVLAANESANTSTIHYFSTYTTVTANESWGVTSTDPADAIIFTLSGTASALKAKDADDSYIQALATGKFRMSGSVQTLKLNDDGTISNPTSGSTGYNLRYNHNNGSGGFRWYNGTTGCSAYFYKVIGGTTYSAYCTTVTTSGPTDASWTVTPDAVSVEVGKTATATISTDYDGTLSVSSNATGTATATISGKTITVTGVAAGTTTLTVTGEETSNFNAISKTIDVTVTGSSATNPAFAYFEKTASINVGEVLDAKDYCGTIATDAGFDAYSISTAICSAIKAGDDNKVSADYACSYNMVSFKKAGTYVVHVTAPAVADKYTASEGYITVTVNSSEENVVFDFNSTEGLADLGINVPTSGEEGACNLAEYYYNGAILMQSTNGSTPNREYYEGENSIDLRVYNNSSLTFSGATITKIVITGSGMSSMSANNGNVNIAENGTATWTGSSSSVVLSPNGSAKMRTITVYYNPTTIPSTYDVIYDGNSCGGNAVTGTPSDDNAYDANASVNVAAATTLTREGYTFNGWNTKSNGTGTTLTAEGSFNINANTVIYAQWLINSYVVTMETPENGSFTVSDGTNNIAPGTSVEYKKKLTLTATPETGYKLKRFVITPEGGGPLEKTTNPAEYTMGAANVTITAEFQALKTYTINWSVNGTILKAEELNEGADVAAPTEQEITDALPDGVEKVFTGWVTTSKVDADSEPEYVTPSKATANATYYAVFAKKTGSGSGTGGDYELVESNLEDWTGEYIIAGKKDDNYLAALPYESGNNVKSTDATVTDNKITSEYAAKLTVTKKDDYYTIKDGTNYWYAAGGNSNNYMKGNISLPTSNYDTYLWTISYSNDKISIVCKASISRNTIRFNSANNPQLFSCYEQGKQNDILLFKKSATTGGATYSDFTTLPYLQLNEGNNAVVVLDGAPSDKVEVTRTLKANDTWNSLCLPFNMDADQISDAFGSDAELRILSTASITGDADNQVLHLNFAEATDIEAGKLYMVRVSTAIEKFTVEGIVEINTTDEPVQDYSSNGYDIKSHSNYSYMDGTTAEGYVPVNSFVISNNKFMQVGSSTQKMKAFRGYITATDASGNPVKALGLGFIDPTTGISNVELHSDNTIYNLQGLRQSKLQKGINIVNGKKIIR